MSATSDATVADQTNTVAPAEKAPVLSTSSDDGSEEQLADQSRPKDLRFWLIIFSLLVATLDRKSVV